MKILSSVLAWAIALAAIAGAANALHRQREVSDITAVLAEVPRFRITPSPFTLADYQAVQKRTAVYGSVEIVPAQEGLSIKAAALADYAAWRLAIDQVLLDSPGVAWRIDYLCSGKCPSGEAHKALLTGTHLSSGI